MCISFTGESYQSLQYTFRVAKSTISDMVPEVCQAMYKELKEEYIQVSCFAFLIAVAIGRFRCVINCGGASIPHLYLCGDTIGRVIASRDCHTAILKGVGRVTGERWIGLLTHGKFKAGWHIAAVDWPWGRSTGGTVFSGAGDWT